jgi:hypothetical protein
MEKAIFPLKYMDVSNDYKEKYNGSYALSFTNKKEKEDVYAPFDGIIRKVYKIRGNYVWLESKEKVLWADGSCDYMTVLTGHDDNVESLYVGKEISFGERYYTQGCAGTDKVKVHIEIGRGKFEGNGWHENDNGIWVIDNKEQLFNAFFLNPFIEIKNDGSYPWRSSIENPVSRNESKDQIQIFIDDLRCRKTPNGVILGHVKKGIYNVNETKEHGGKLWIKIGESNYIASCEGSTKYLQKKIVENKSNKDIKRTEKIKEFNDLKKIFTCKKDGVYYLKLYKGEEVYIKDKVETK